ncbi:MAG: SDR family oxidoreductase [Clostridia bacterium]|jgi:NADP-dependent 3-hydroxy acid dehydrogenase YdfG|nr:SDR family oxidoreductase [Clostridia bacterium]
MKKLVVITGASSGIGSEMAIKFSGEGHPLLLLARRKEKMEALGLKNCICEGVDILDIESYKKAIAKAVDKYGPVDLLINNAGLMLLGEPTQQPIDEWHNMIDVNVKGVMNGITLVLDSMVKRNGGTIINISSIAGRKTFPQHAAYCASKFAVHAISENLREEVCDKNVRVIVIGPGVTQTELLSHTTDEIIKSGYEEWKKEIGGAMSPSATADTAYFVYNQPQNVCIREVLLAPTMQKG